MSDRQQRGLAIAALYRIEKQNGKWVVPSQKGDGTKYTVDADPEHPHCTCPDHTDRGVKCKHMFAVEFTLTRERGADGSETITRTFTVRESVTYKQDWPNYNKAQTQEKRLFLSLLHDLCQGIPEPPRAKTGRRPIRRADLLFSALYKVYSTVSTRRFQADLDEAAEKGYIERAPRYNTLIEAFESPELTPILRSLIVESAKPLAAVEVDFAGDSSGFTTSRFVKWFDHKYGTVRQQHDWVKVHIMCGVKTNVVTAVEIKERLAQDAPQLPALIKQTAETFTMREVSLDKAYASYDNYDAIEATGAVPYIPFKSIHTGKGRGGLWAKMFHYFHLNREDFLRHYHKRSNAESTFSMIKAKFRDHVRSKSDTGMINEALAKLVCHNLCCLIHAAFELGVEAAFWGREDLDDEPRPVTDDEAVGALAWV